LQKLNLDFDSRDLDKQSLSEAELDRLIGDRDYKFFLNTRNELYRQQDMKNKPPSRPQAIKLLAKNPNLIRRPLLVRETEILFGFDEETYNQLKKSK